MAERQFGPYKLIRQIAVGGMAEIHLAKTAGIAGFEKYVALKMIHPNFAEDEQFIQMLVDEAKIAVQLTHGNIAQTFDLGRVGDTYYITMEYVDGADLYKILRRASEQDIEMPLDVCAFVGKEVASALDHAHRKRDHAGKSLGIVHRDVSPQNVLVSYSGEVKLVDFGIAKATMKVRQTAVGVIKGKYYYMSPEQARGELIDYRSDIFSAGIVLYEMITGQMLYLEEDLHKLLEMARAAEIRPPSVLRRGVPPQLERIVMHALARSTADRYQSAADFASDLERFLHTYQPAFTASKLSALLREVAGDPIQVPDDPAFVSIEFRGGAMSTHPLDDSELVHASDELRDENSVIFRVSDLQKPAAPQLQAHPPPQSVRPSRPSGSVHRPSTPPPRSSTPQPSPIAAVPRQSAPRVTRPSDPLPALIEPARRSSSTKVPSIVQPRPSGKLPSVVKPRQAHEETRELASPAPPDPLHDDSSGLITPDGRKLAWEEADRSDTSDEDLGDLENIGERTLITGAPGMSFMMDFAGDGDSQVEATLVTTAPTGPGFGPEPGGHLDSTAAPEDDDDDDEDGPTLSRELSLDQAVRPAIRPATRPVPPKAKAPPPAGLAAKIHAPAVSELRKPRASRRTPPGGSPLAPSNVLQAIVGARTSEPMPSPRPASSSSPAATHATIAMPPQVGIAPGMMPPGMMAQGGMQSQQMPPSGMQSQQMPPSGMQSQQMPPQQMPPSGMQFQQMQPQQMMPQGMMPQMRSPQMMSSGGMSPQMMSSNGMSPQMMIPSGPQTPTEPYAGQFPVSATGGQPSYNHDASGLPMGTSTPPGMSVQPQGMPYPTHDHAGNPLASQMSPHGYPQMSPSALYQFQPPPQLPMSLTGQLRLAEIDEIPSQYKIGAARRRWFTYIVSGILAVSVAAGVTFLIIRTTRESTPITGSVHLSSVPSGAEVVFDGTRLSDRTPLTIDRAPVGTRHTISIELPHYAPHAQTLDIPKDGHAISVTAQLASITGKIPVNTVPSGAEVRIHGQLRGVTPTTINDVDIDSTKTIELRHKDFPPHEIVLKWTADGRAPVDYRFTR